MARYFIWKCNECNFKFTAFGPQECNILHEGDKKTIKPLPHPTTYIAKGLFIHGYCKSCKAEKDKIIVEYIKPSNPFEVEKSNIIEDYLKNYSGWINNNPDKKTIYTECYNYDAAICPNCSDKLIVYPFKKSFSCPECNKGNVEMISEYMS